MQPEILTLPFQPSRHPQLGLEALTVADLRLRAGALLARPQRLLFFSLFAFTAGDGAQMVDFEAVPWRAGDLLLIAPQQVFQLSLPASCAGFVIIYRPDFLPAGDGPGPPDEADGRAPLFTGADPDERRAIEADCGALLAAYQRHDGGPLSAQIMAHQLRIILLRLARLSALDRPPRHDPHAALVRRFRALLEAQYRQSRSLTDYARQLHCSPRTLQRAVAAVTGQRGKAYIDGRVLLEAKRLLAHTGDPVEAIGAALGFSEATNFGKFFRRHAGVSPEQFRRRYR